MCLPNRPGNDIYYSKVLSFVNTILLFFENFFEPPPPGR